MAEQESVQQLRGWITWGQAGGERTVNVTWILPLSLQPAKCDFVHVQSLAMLTLKMSGPIFYLLLLH